ncbi:MAG: hypothetical protein HND57_08620 [Planctomycetes bacterium]|nr:hypothetical protein [Planctomycetota bacterium]
MTRMHINENSKTFSPFGRATAYGRFSRSDVGVVRYVLTLCFLVIAGCQVAQRDFSRAVPPTPAASQVLRGAWRDLDEAVNSACADKNVMMAVIESDRWALATHYTLLQANEGSAEILAIRNPEITDDRQPQDIYVEVRVGGAFLRNTEAETAVLQALADAFDQIARTAAKAHRQ